MTSTWTPDQSVETFTEQWQKQVAEDVEKTGIPLERWRAGGRASKANPNKEDASWWLAEGPKMVDAYAAWRDSVNLQLWFTPAGEPAVEIGITQDIGGVAVRAFIDRIFDDGSEDDPLVIVDLKTGSRTPDSDLQLGFYRVLIWKLFGVWANKGAYWMGRSGGLTPYVDLTKYTEDYLGEILQQFRRALDGKVFIPSKSSMCGSCGVKAACYSNDGPLAHLYDPLHPDYKGF